jgi:ribosome recycling factor
VKKLLGRTDIEDALKKLEKLEQDEAMMAIAQILKVTHNAIDGAQSIF